MSHANTPWVIVKNHDSQGGRLIVKAAPKDDLGKLIKDIVIAEVSNQADAYRIVECVNAMDDIEKPAEFMMTIRSIKHGIFFPKSLADIHNELTRAKELVKSLENDCKYLKNRIEVIKKQRK